MNKPKKRGKGDRRHQITGEAALWGFNPNTGGNTSEGRLMQF